jgi:hypothetical protein
MPELWPGEGEEGRACTDRISLGKQSGSLVGQYLGSRLFNKHHFTENSMETRSELRRPDALDNKDGGGLENSKGVRLINAD